MDTVLSYVLTGYTWILDKIQFLFSVNEFYSKIIFWLIIFYLCVFLIFVPLHKFFKRRRIIKEQEIVTDVDEMIYLLAKAQHEKNIDVRALGGNPNIALMKSIFTKGHCDYVQSTFLILDNMHKVETLLGNKIISIEKESLLLKDSKKYKFIKACENFFFWICTGSTLGIYYLFK